MKNKLILATSLTLVALVANPVCAGSSYLPGKYGLYASVKALYSQPSNVNFNEELAGSAKHEVNTLASYSPGFDVALGYFVTDTDDVSFNYLHTTLSTRHSSSSTEAYIDGESSFYASEKVKFVDNFNNLSIRLGHFYDTDFYNTHVFAGIDYATLKESRELKAVSVEQPGVEPAELMKSERIINIINGLGPLIGFESMYKYRDHFTIGGGANVSLLASSYGESDTPYEGPSTSYNTAFKAQGNIGLGYHTALEKNVNLDVEVGYQSTYMQDNSIGFSFSMHGPYLGFKIH